MLSTSVVWPPTSPAPNSRGPHLSALGRRLLPLPVTPFSQTSLPSPEPKTSRRASLRMPSDETLRFTLVCKLPLLHFSRSRVAVVQRFSFRRITVPYRCPLVQAFRKKLFPVDLSAGSLAVPPPPFRLHAYLRRCLTRSELPLRTHSSRSLFRGFLRPRLPFWTSSGLWASLSSASNRLSFLRQLSLCARLLFLLKRRTQNPQPRVTFDSHPSISGVATLIRFPFQRRRFRGRHFAAPSFEFMVRVVTLSSLPRTV
jgi:hypothetical protein